MQVVDPLKGLQQSLSTNKSMQDVGGRVERVTTDDLVRAREMKSVVGALQDDLCGKSDDNTETKVHEELLQESLKGDGRTAKPAGSYGSMLMGAIGKLRDLRHGYGRFGAWTLCWVSCRQC